MQLRSFTLLQDHELLRSLDAVMSRDHGTTAEMLAHLSEVISRRLWADEGYPSMYEFCVSGLHMSEGVALKRIQAAKTANEFPAIHALVAQGRLHLSAVCMLAPRLTPENAAGLLAAAVHQSKAGIARVLAEWFPRPDVPTSLCRVETGAYDPDHAASDPPRVPESTHMPRARVAPLSAETYELRCTLGKHLHEKLRYVQALLGSAVASSDVPAVLELALDALMEAKEKQKFAVTSRPRQQKGKPQGRHIPAQVRREVLEKEGGCCTFRSDNGTRCGTQRNLHFDHIEPFASGGESTTDNLRLRCAAHNRLEAERRYGKGFMERKVQAAQETAPTAREESGVEPEPVDLDHTTHDPDHTAILAQRREIIPYLLELGHRAERARYGAALSDHLLGQPLAVRVKFSIQQLAKARFEQCTVRLHADT